MRIIATIEGQAITEYADGSVGYVGKGRVDADGSGGNPFGDPDFQPATSLKHNGASLNANVDQYIAVPPEIVHGVKPIVLGCLAFVIWGKRCTVAVVADVGPHSKLGEISVACARALGMNPSPLNGGEDQQVVHVVLYPGTPSPGYSLQPS